MKGLLNILVSLTLAITASHSFAQVTIAWTGTSGNIVSNNAGGNVSFGKFEGGNSNILLEGGLQNTVGVLAGLSELEVQKTFTVYPNPTRGLVFVDIPSDVTVEIFSLQGRLVHTSNSGQIDIHHLSSGTYIVTTPGYESSRIIKF